MPLLGQRLEIIAAYRFKYITKFLILKFYSMNYTITEKFGKSYHKYYLNFATLPLYKQCNLNPMNIISLFDIWIEVRSYSLHIQEETTQNMQFSLNCYRLMLMYGPSGIIYLIPIIGQIQLYMHGTYVTGPADNLQFCLNHDPRACCVIWLPAI